MRIKESDNMKILYSQFVVIMIILSACSVFTPAPTPTPFEQYYVILRCDDCKEIGMKITLWNDVKRSGSSGVVDPDSVMTVLAETDYNGVHYYKVRSILGIDGWVSELFIEKQQP